MPYYEYRCPSCQAITSVYARIAEKPKNVLCDQGCGTAAQAIISKPNVKLSSISKVERMDPKYDKMVDQAAKSNPLSDPDTYINRRGDPGKGKPD